MTKVLTKKHINKERGFASIYLVSVSVVIMMFGMVIWMQHQQAGMETERAHAQGRYLALMTNATRAYVAVNQSAILALGATQVFNGTFWLKDAACGGTAVAPYLPCSFPDVDPYNNTLVTTVGSELGVIGAGSILVALAQTVAPPLTVNGLPRMDLTEQAIGFAEGYAAPTSNAASINSFVNFDIDLSATPGVRGRLLARSSMAAASTDLYLRTDGANQMHADINIGGNNVINALNGSFAGVVTGSDVKTTAGRTLRTSAIIQNIVPLIPFNVGPASAWYSYADISTVGYTCDTGLTLTLFAKPVQIGHNDAYNGLATYAVVTATSFQIRVRLHTTTWTGAISTLASFVEYTLRCQ